MLATSHLPPPSSAISSKQWLFTESDLHSTPSAIAGLPLASERQNRAKGVHFIMQAGVMLKLPQITLATASVFLHRFFMRFPMISDPSRPSLMNYHYYSIAAACLFLATKVEENCRKMKDLIVACVRVAQKQPSKEVDEQDKEFWRWRDTILSLEDVLLEALCFDLSLESPYTALYNLLILFGEQDNKPLRNAAWTFVSDSVHTPLCLLYPAHVIAAAAIYAAARHCDIRLLDDQYGRPWWEVASVELGGLKKACNFMADTYQNVPNKRPQDRLHARTPEEEGDGAGEAGDRIEAKTRRVRPEGEILPLPQVSKADDRGSARRSPGVESVGSRKRDRGRLDGREDGEVMEGVRWGGSSGDEAENTGREVKKAKKEAQSQANGNLSQTIGAKDKAEEPDGGGLVSPRLDDASEEGELEQ